MRFSVLLRLLLSFEQNFSRSTSHFVIGLALILLPYSVVGITLRIIGAVLLALEIYRAIPYCRRGADPTALLMFILSEIFVIIFAFIMLLNPIGAVNALCVVFGIYLVISAAIELYRLSKLSFIKIGVNTKGQFFRASFGRRPQVPNTARQAAPLPGDISRDKRSSMPQPKTRPESPVPSLQGPCDRSLKSEVPCGSGLNWR